MKRNRIKKMQLPYNKILEPKRFMKYEGKGSPWILPIILKLIVKPNLKICDVGGASGVFLNDVLLKSKFEIKTFILEINEFYKNKIVNKNIQFLHGSILDGTIEDNCFDIVVFRHLLHHLVSNNLKNTLHIQKFALNEIFKITKKEGYVIFIELVNQIRLFSWLIYLFSKITNKFKIKLKHLNLGKVIICFLSQKSIKDVVNQFKEKYNLQIIKEIFYPQTKYSLKWKLTLLMSNVGYVFYVIKVLK